MFRKLLFPILVLLLCGFVAHKFYVAVTEVGHNEERNTFEVSIQFIGHDLEYALENAGVPNLYLGMEKEAKDADEYLLSYINKHVEIKVDNKKTTLHFVGKEVNNDDAIYCYLETDKLPSFNEVKINNTLLTEVFPLQSNLVYLTIANEKIDFKLTSEDTSGSHRLK